MLDFDRLARSAKGIVYVWGLALVFVLSCNDSGSDDNLDTDELDAGRTDSDDVLDTDSEDTDTDTDISDSDASVPEDILDQLRAIDGLRVVENPISYPGYRYFILHYRQPADHDDPDGATFNQYMTLLHKSPDAPMVMITEGYSLSIDSSRTELTLLLEANQLAVEHRYFANSRPRPADWSLLTIEQSAADHHRIITALKPIYPEAWITTGQSKGGMTSVFHRRFYPDDVNGSVPYVTPIMFGLPDERFIDFLKNTGEPECREKIHSIQVEALVRREAMLGLMQTSLTTQFLTFSRVGGRVNAFEITVNELSFSFWQYHGIEDCSSVPPTSATNPRIFNFIDDRSGFYSFSDITFEFMSPFYYQAAAELGYPVNYMDHIADLFETDLLGTDQSFLNEGILPKNAEPPTFNPQAMLDIADWIATEGSQLMFIYGEFDPWTAAAVDLGDATDSHVFIAPLGTHGAAISDLVTADHALAMETLERWTGVTPSPPPPDTQYRMPTMPRVFHLSGIRAPVSHTEAH
ncbi:MAG: aminopeptidase [Proteobacteria bacterium]|nr:aminopeptidase [Pseudomonadota bacterium]